MLDIQRALADERLLRALTGLNPQAFEALKGSFSDAMATEDFYRAKSRERAKGAGRKPRLDSTEKQLFYILFYFKCYPTFDLASVLFDLDRSQANRWMHRLKSVLAAALGREMALPQRKLTSVKEFLEHFPEAKRVMLDGTHRPIQRPQKTQAQKANYSGKKSVILATI